MTWWQWLLLLTGAPIAFVYLCLLVGWIIEATDPAYPGMWEDEL